MIFYKSVSLIGSHKNKAVLLHGITWTFFSFVHPSFFYARYHCRHWNLEIKTKKHSLVPSLDGEVLNGGVLGQMLLMEHTPVGPSLVSWKWRHMRLPEDEQVRWGCERRNMTGEWDHESIYSHGRKESYCILLHSSQWLELKVVRQVSGGEAREADRSQICKDTLQWAGVLRLSSMRSWHGLTCMLKWFSNVKDDPEGIAGSKASGRKVTKMS